MGIVNVTEAVHRLKLNQVVAIPTETVYGLAGRISSPDALRLIFTTKERPLFDPLIVHVLGKEQIPPLVRAWPDAIVRLTETFWPGPLTVVVPKSDRIDSLISSGLDTVGLRSPAHPVARQILEQLGEPVAAPSANRFGRTSPTRAQHVLSEFGDDIPVVDGGDSDVGIESTVVRWNDGPPPTLEILRPGAITRNQLADALKGMNKPVTITTATSHASPGHLEHHYQPAIPLIVVKGEPSAEHHQRAARELGVPPNSLWRMQLPRDARLAARELYHCLRTLSDRREGGIVYWAGPEWDSPEWDALRDRLARAATKLL